jgi:hypothetical protein
MTIPAELGKFGKEEGFIDQFIIPLLHRLGFSVVINYHGSREFGKDIVFGQIDHFGHVVYHGLQAKYEPSISLAAVESLIQDAKQAFHNPFEHPQTGVRERISTFYVFNAGSVSDQAREHFFNSLSNPFGGNIRLIDGQALVYLDRWAALAHGQDITERLSGMLFEVRNNIIIARHVEEQLKAFVDKDEPYPMQRLITTAVSGYLERPIIQQKTLSIGAVQTYARQCQIFNAVIDSIDVPLKVENYKKTRAGSAIGLVPKIVAMGNGIEKAIVYLLGELGRPFTGI